MFQPFLPFKTRYLEAIFHKGQYYVVTQTYKRHMNHFEPSRTGLLVTAYAEKSAAQTHRQALQNDQYAALLDLQRPAHYAKLQELCGEGSSFVLYWAMVRDADVVEKVLKTKYRMHMRNYIDNRTNWRLSREELVRVYVEVVFGELFVVLRHVRKELRVRFEDIETA